MPNVFLTSDSHFGHENIIQYCNRPFVSAQEMDETLIERWNSAVKPADKVYHLGDVAMNERALKAVMPRLNGSKRLIRGNHDIFKTKLYLQWFKEVYSIRVLDGLALTHIPIHPDSMGRYRANVHGHVHNSTALKFPYVNVCVEVTGYAPVALESVTACVKFTEDVIGLE